jgi:creatinine amidohydrolase
MKNKSIWVFSFVLVSFALIFSVNISAQSSEKSPNLSVRLEELTAPEFVQAVSQSRSTCLIPIGVLEKHGPHLPLGTDYIDVREIALRAAKKEYCVVFPEYYFSQIFEAKHQPGTIAYSTKLIWNLLEESCQELARNGIKNIILVNGHGGNEHFLPFFCQAQLESQKDYAVILFSPEEDPKVNEKIGKLRKTDSGGHAGELETSMILAVRPDLAHVERGKDQSGEDLNRLGNLPYGYTGIWWYAKYPNHYAGDGSQANREIGELRINSRANQLTKLIQAVKAGNKIQELQQLFFKDARRPLKTKQK